MKKRLLIILLFASCATSRDQRVNQEYKLAIHYYDKWEKYKSSIADTLAAREALEMFALHARRYDSLLQDVKR